MITDLFRPFIEIQVFAAQTPEEEDIAVCLLSMYDNGLLKVSFNRDEEPVFSLREDVTDTQFENARQDYLNSTAIKVRANEC